MNNIPYNNINTKSFYESVNGHNCENVIGFSAVPIGIVGPLKINNNFYHIPVSTTEGALIASANRGASIINKCGGVTSIITREGMTRAPVIECKSLHQLLEIQNYCLSKEGFEELKVEFSKCTSHGYLKSIQTVSEDRNLHIRLQCFTGDAMGMNMVTKGSKFITDKLVSKFEGCKLISLSGNVYINIIIFIIYCRCTDKKSSSANWLLGRGYSVISEVTVDSELLSKLLHIRSVKDLVNINTIKNLKGSSLSGTIGGNNAQAANYVAGIFLATGQDLGQVIESSNCLTSISESEEDKNGRKECRISCSMPSIEVGTIGGGTKLPSQKGCLELLSLYGSSNLPSEKPKILSEIVCSTVLCGEISLLGSLCANDLVKAHMVLGRNEKK